MDYPVLPGLTTDGLIYQNRDMGTLETLLSTGVYPTAHASALLELPAGEERWLPPTELSGNPARSAQDPFLLLAPSGAARALCTAQPDRQPGRDNMHVAAAIMRTILDFTPMV